jgi:G3E family GTPase
LKAADLLILNKCDRINNEQQEHVESWLKEQIANVPILPAYHAKLPFDLLFSGLDHGQYKEEGVAPNSIHHHGHIFTSVTLQFDSPVAIEELRNRLSALPTFVLRAKGFVASKEDPNRFYLVQLAGRHIDITEVKNLSGEIKRASNIVFIGLRDMLSREWLEKTLT